MSQSRFRPGFALLVVSGLVAAAFAGGCAAPKSSEKARFGTVMGTVVDANGNPVPGALVTVVPRASANAIGTVNYAGDVGPFVTDSRGRFFIQGITLQPNDTAVLNLRVQKDGFTPSVASITTNSAVTIAGRTIPAGTQTPDIVVAQEVVTGATAVLQGVGQVAQVGSAGATITAGVPNPNGGSLGNATVVIPAGAVAQPTTISVTPLTGDALPGPVTITSGTVLAPGTTVTANTPLAAIDLEPTGLTFPAGSFPTITMPIPVTLPVGSTIPVQVFDPTTGTYTFETNATVLAGGNTISFQVSHFSGRIAVLPSTWTEGAVSPVLETVVFPPIATFPDGYIATARISQSLTFTGTTPGDDAFLANAFGGITQQTANGPLPVVVPAGNKLGVNAERHTIPVTVTFNSRTVTGVRTIWILTVVPVTPVATPPAHLQGHIQGGAVGS